MAATTSADIAAHLRALGVAEGANLAVHSRLLSFGRVDGGAGALYDALRDAVGPNGTLVFPTYTLNLDAKTPYDPATTPSHNVGSLSEYARCVPGARRTLCPLHSHVVIGAKAELLMGADPARSIGPGSSFEVMHKVGFQSLLLGCTFHEGATFVHHVEAMVGVPYREWVEFDRQVVMPDGALRAMRCRYYGRRRQIGFTNDLSACELAARAHHQVVSVPIAASKRTSHLIPLATLHECVDGLLARDPYALVKRGYGHGQSRAG